MATKDVSKLDLAFLLDCTSSMGPYIENAKKNINSIADEIKRTESCHLRIALVKYRDHPPQDHTFITQVDDFTDKIVNAKRFIDAASPQGGGDGPESICCALHECLNSLSWRDSAVKVAILICDAPPHGLGSPGDGFPHGCPTHNDPVDIVHQMAAKSITLYCAGCEPSLTPYRQFFVALTLITGGQYVPLNSAENLAKVIVGGTREEISMEKLMAQVHEEVMKEAAAKGTRVDEDELTRRIHNILNSQGSTINKATGSEEVKIEDGVKEMSREKTLADMVKFSEENNISLFDTTAATFGGFSGFTPSFSRYSYKRRSRESRYYYGKRKDYDYDYDPYDDDDDDEEYGSKKKKGRGAPAKKTTYASARPRVAKTTVAINLKKKPSASPAVSSAAVSSVVVRKDDKKDDDSTTKPKDDSASSDASGTETINLDQARRMVKKAIARNNLSS